jgi:anti-anti-sigma factor
MPGSADAWTGGRRPNFASRRVDVEHVTHVMVSGELDLATVPVLEADLRAAEAQAAFIVLDLRRLEFIDVRGARLVLDTDRRMCEKDGRLIVLVRSGSEVEWCLAATGVDRQIQVQEGLGASDATRASPFDPGQPGEDPHVASSRLA